MGAPDTVNPVRVPTLVSDDAVTPLASVAPVKVPAGAMTTLPEAAVTKPLPLTVNEGIDVDEPKLPTFEFTVARVAASVPDVVISPDKSPFVIALAPENFVRLPEAGEPVVVTVPPPVNEAQFAVEPLLVRNFPDWPVVEGSAEPLDGLICCA